MKIYVLGPHGSGNRLHGRLAAGNPRRLPIDVFSLPGDIRQKRIDHTPPNVYVLMRRDDESTAHSMLKEGMVRDLQQGRAWVREARRQQQEWIGGLRGDDRFMWWDYEDTVRGGAMPFIAELARGLECDPWMPPDEEIYDANLRYSDPDAFQDHQRQLGREVLSEGRDH